MKTGLQTGPKGWLAMREASGSKANIASYLVSWYSGTDHALFVIAIAKFDGLFPSILLVEDTWKTKPKLMMHEMSQLAMFLHHHSFLAIFERLLCFMMLKKPLAYYMWRTYNSTILATASQGWMAPLVCLSSFFRRRVDHLLLPANLLKC